jgi:hypothetical protein
VDLVDDRGRLAGRGEPHVVPVEVQGRDGAYRPAGDLVATKRRDVVAIGADGLGRPLDPDEVLEVQV